MFTSLSHKQKLLGISPGVSLLTFFARVMEGRASWEDSGATGTDVTMSWNRDRIFLGPWSPVTVNVVKLAPSQVTHRHWQLGPIIMGLKGVTCLLKIICKTT